MLYFIGFNDTSFGFICKESSVKILECNECITVHMIVIGSMISAVQQCFYVKCINLTLICLILYDVLVYFISALLYLCIEKSAACTAAFVTVIIGVYCSLQPKNKQAASYSTTGMLRRL